MNSSFEIVENVIFAQDFVGCVQGDHDQGDVFFELKHLLKGPWVKVDVEFGGWCSVSSAC